MSTIEVAVKGVCIHNGKMLIVQRNSNDQTGANTWENVGGVMQFGEQFEQALKREFIEEVGLSIKVLKLLFATTFQTSPSRQIVLLSYLCALESQNLISINLSDEHSHYLWANEQQLRTLLPKAILNDFEQYNVLNYLYEKE